MTARDLYLCRLLCLLIEGITVNVEGNMLDHLVGQNQHHHESVSRVCAYRKSQVRTSAIKEVVSVF